MQLVLATSNMDKVKEFTAYSDHLIMPYSAITEPFEIDENGATFAQNALIKARAVYEKVGKEYLVLADDSGISVPALGNEPGIYSARYAKAGASDKENLDKLIEMLKISKIVKTPAFYTAALALVYKDGEFVVHGWMHGDVIIEPRGRGGFGYDPIFVPEGYEQTLGELDATIKAKFSHRSRALKLIEPIIKMIRESV